MPLRSVSKYLLMWQHHSHPGTKGCSDFVWSHCFFPMICAIVYRPWKHTSAELGFMRHYWDLEAISRTQCVNYLTLLFIRTQLVYLERCFLWLERHNPQTHICLLMSHRQTSALVKQIQSLKEMTTDIIASIFVPTRSKIFCIIQVV